MKLQVLRSKTALERLECSRRRDYARAGKKEDECECTRKSKRGKSRGSETTKNGLARWSRFALASARAGSFGLLLSDEWRREWARLEPEKELDIQRETPHSRRETLVGASCCTGSLDGSLDVTRSQSSLSWNLAKGSRRLCNSVLLLSFVPSRSSARAESEQQVYVSPDNGFKILPPPEWEQGSKSGAAILFKDPSYKFNNLGVTVTPVRVSKLEEFGSVEDAANKLIAFEKGKESTTEATINSLASRRLEDLLYYDFDYTLKTTRGNKRVVSTVCINQNKLYIANGQYFCGESCGEENAEKLMEIKSSLKTFVTY